jgi:hypothetical protein
MGPGGQGRGVDLSPEKAQAAWELAAKGVAGRLSLSAEQTTALSRAYVEARTTMRSKMEELRKQRDSGGDVNPMEAQRDAEAGVKKTFDKALADAKISDANVTKINASLGAPVGLNGRPWDRMVDTIAGMKLDSAKQQTALNSIEDYMVSMSKTMETMRGGDREGAQKSMADAREKLNAELKVALTEEQMKTFEENAGMRPRGGGRPGGPDGAPKNGEKPKDGGNGGEKPEPKKK